jgi:hypothetical protein
VVSELVSNVLLHAHGGPMVRLVGLPAGIRVEVADDSPQPTALHADLGGFGLRVVERLGRAWGVSRRGHGKVVWCELPANQDPAIG